MKDEKEQEHAKEQAKLQYESIAEIVKELRDARESDDNDAVDIAERRMDESPLDIQVRSDWHSPGTENTNAEYSILLCTGGPACRITGELNQYCEPETARIEYQDWFTAWADWPLDSAQEAVVLEYAQHFYFDN